MKKFKSHKMYFPLAVVLSLSPMVFKSINQEIKPEMMTRSIASLQEEKPTEAEVIKYEKADFEKRSSSVSEQLSSVEKQLLDVVLKKDKVFEQSLHDIINEQFVKIDELEKIQTESEDDKKIVSEKVSELRKLAGELCDRLEKVAASTKYDEEKVADKPKEEPKKEEECDLQTKYTELSKQVESMTADHKKYLDVIVGMNQMMISMYQHQQPQYSPYTYTSGPFGAAFYPYHNQSGLGQVTNNYYYNGSPMQSPQMMGIGQNYGQQPQIQPQMYQGEMPIQGIQQQQQPQQQVQQLQPMVMQQNGYDPRYTTMNVMPGQLGDGAFMHNFEVQPLPSPMIVDGGRAPAVLPF